MADKVPALAGEQDLDANAWFCDYQAADVELVDMTDDLVRAVRPAGTGVADGRGADPVDLDTLAEMRPED